jgi:hypothetical protein
LKDEGTFDPHFAKINLDSVNVKPWREKVICHFRQLISMIIFIFNKFTITSFLKYDL